MNRPPCRILEVLAAIALLLAPTARAAEGEAKGSAAAASTAGALVKVRLVDPHGGRGASSGRWLAASLASAKRATLSTRLSATVREVLVEEGAHVKKGQVLVRLADSDLRAQLSAAEAGLATAAAQERRMKALAAERAATPVELELAQAERARASAAVVGARESLTYTALRSPFDGTVQSRRVHAGDLVGPGQPLLELQGDKLEIQATLSSAESASLRIGDRVRFEARAGDAMAQGEAKVTALSAGGDPLSHRRFLRAEVAGAPEGLRSGAFARVELPARAASASGKGSEPATGEGAASTPGEGVSSEIAWVPQSAVVQRGDLTGVFVAEDGRAHLRWILARRAHRGRPGGAGRAAPRRAGDRRARRAARRAAGGGEPWPLTAPSCAPRGRSSRSRTTDSPAASPAPSCAAS